MKQVNRNPVVGNYDTFDKVSFAIDNRALIPVFEVSIENLISEDFIKNEIDWDKNETLASSNRILVSEKETIIKQKLKPLLEQISKENIMKMIDELISINPNMFSYWGTVVYDNDKPPSNFLSKILDISIFLVKDSNENKLDPHFDSRRRFGTIIINLIDNNVSTQFFDYARIAGFYKYQKNDIDVNQPTKFIDGLIYEAPTKAGTGVFWINCETTLHGVGINQNTPKDRYTIMVNLNLKL
jgi:hypothetical protein